MMGHVGGERGCGGGGGGGGEGGHEVSDMSVKSSFCPTSPSFLPGG